MAFMKVLEGWSLPILTLPSWPLNDVEDIEEPLSKAFLVKRATEEGRSSSLPFRWAAHFFFSWAASTFLDALQGPDHISHPQGTRAALPTDTIAP